MPENFPFDEKELLSQLRLGNEEAFGKIYKIYSSSLYSNLLRLVKLEAEAKEILQDVFLKIWLSRGNIDLDKSFGAYLTKIAENKVYDFFRKMARDKKKETMFLEMASSFFLGEEELNLSEEKAAMLDKAIELLPDQRQQVFRLCKLEGKTYKEVSELLNISVSTISDHIVKATKAIKAYFEDRGALPSFLFIFIIY